MASWYLYVLQSQSAKYQHGTATAPVYVGSTTDPVRRFRQHNGELVGGAKFTASRRPWQARALYGPYQDRSEAFRAENALKKLRGEKRIAWSGSHPLKRGLGEADPWVKDPTRFTPTKPRD